MTDYPSIKAKIHLYGDIIKEEHRKPKSERRNDLPRIIKSQKVLNRWMVELTQKQ